MNNADYREWVEGLYSMVEGRGNEVIECDHHENIVESIRNRKLRRAPNLKFVYRRSIKLLIIPECGYGDAIWQWRFVKELSKYIEIYLICHKFTKPLFEEDLKNSNIHTIHLVDNIPPDIVYYIWSFDLLYFFQDAITSNKYLNIPYNKTPSSKKKVGLAFGNTDKEEDMSYRNIPRKWTKSFSKYELYNFGSYKSSYINVLDECSNFLDTAKKIQEMDYVVCADNVILHLAGALEVKTFAIFIADHEPIWWYNMNKRDVGWYKSVKPFICKEESDIQSAIIKIKQLIDKGV